MQLRVMTRDGVINLHVGTNLDDNFPRRFNHFVENVLRDVNISLQTRRQFPGGGYVLQF